jgi:hypothetical protein
LTLIRFDENLSQRLVVALRAYGLPPGISIEHANEAGQNGVHDVDWLPRFKTAGGRCILSGDTKMRGKIAERMALQEAGFVTIFPPKGSWYADLKRHGQAAYFIRWMPEIARLAQKAEDGQHFELPATFDLDPDRVKLLRRLTGPDLREVVARAAAKADAQARRRAARARAKAATTPLLRDDHAVTVSPKPKGEGKKSKSKQRVMGNSG